MPSDSGRPHGLWAAGPGLSVPRTSALPEDVRWTEKRSRCVVGGSRSLMTFGARGSFLESAIVAQTKRCGLPWALAKASR
jgi:hypothetical protein